MRPSNSKTCSPPRKSSPCLWLLLGESSRLELWLQSIPNELQHENFHVFYDHFFFSIFVIPVLNNQIRFAIFFKKKINTEICGFFLTLQLRWDTLYSNIHPISPSPFYQPSQPPFPQPPFPPTTDPQRFLQTKTAISRRYSISLVVGLLRIVDFLRFVDSFGLLLGPLGLRRMESTQFHHGRDHSPEA